MAQTSFIIVPLSILPQPEKTTTKKPKRRFSQKQRSPLLRKTMQKHFLPCLWGRGCPRNDASCAFYRLAFRYVWSVYGRAARGGEEAGDDSCPTHFSTEPSGEWSEKGCMGTALPHSERVPLMKHPNADLETTCADLDRCDRLCRLCLAQLFPELQSQLV